MTSYSTILALHSYREHRLKAVFILHSLHELVVGRLAECAHAPLGPAHGEESVLVWVEGSALGVETGASSRICAFVPVL